MAEAQGCSHWAVAAQPRGRGSSGRPGPGSLRWRPGAAESWP